MKARGRQAICERCGATIEAPQITCMCGEIIQWSGLPLRERPVYRPTDPVGIELGLVFRSADDLEKWRKIVEQAGPERLSAIAAKIPSHRKGPHWTRYIVSIIAQRVGAWEEQQQPALRDADFLRQ